MYTKPEKYYRIALRKSLKSFRANNYVVVPYEYKTAEAAEKNVLNANKKLPGMDTYKEAIIIECIINPIKTINLQDNGKELD